MKKLSIALTSIFMSAPMVAAAQKVGGQGVLCDNFQCKISANSILNAIIKWVLGISALIAVLFLIIGGVMYVTSAGNADRAKSARQTILYAVIGLIVIVLAFFIVTFVINLSNLFGGAASK